MNYNHDERHYAKSMANQLWLSIKALNALEIDIKRFDFAKKMYCEERDEEGDLLEFLFLIEYFIFLSQMFTMSRYIITKQNY